MLLLMFLKILSLLLYDYKYKVLVLINYNNLSRLINIKSLSSSITISILNRQNIANGNTDTLLYFSLKS